MTQTLFYFIKSVLMGIIMAMPIGPIALICIRKTLEHGFAATISVGLGAAVADAVYASVAAFGVSTIASFLIQNIAITKIIGGLLLLFLAYQELKNKSSREAKTIKSTTLVWLVIEVFFLTLANPLTILTFVAVFVGINKVPQNVTESIAIALGVPVGSLLWSMFIGIVALYIKNKLPPKWMNKVGYIAATIFGLFGIYSILDGLAKLYL